MEVHGGRGGSVVLLDPICTWGGFTRWVDGFNLNGG